VIGLTPDQVKPLVFWGAAGLLLLAIMGGHSAAGARNRREPGSGIDVLSGIWWFVTGGWVDGIRRSNASWFRRGTRAYLINDRMPGRWHFFARIERAAIRWVGTAITAGLVWSYTARPDATVGAVARVGWVLAVPSLAVAGYKSAGSLLLWGHRRRWVWPLFIALHAKLGYPEDYHPRRWMYVPPDFEDGGHSIIIDLPADFTDADVFMVDGGTVVPFQGRQAGGGLGAVVKKVLMEKLPLHEKQFVWHLKGQDHYLEILPIPTPPALVSIKDSARGEAIRDLALAQPESAPLLGLAALPLERKGRDGKPLEIPPTWVAAGGRPVAVDFDAESPHLLVVGAPGVGKSNTLSIIAAQHLRNGGLVVVLDRKEFSLKCLRGLPGVTYLSAIEDIHNGLVNLWAEAERRNQAYRDWDDDADGKPNVGPRILVIVEEGNVLSGKLAKYWKKIKTSEDDKDSPADEALDNLLFAGRAIRMNVAFVAQSGTVRAIGGVERRECFGGAKLLGRYSQNGWRMLVPEVMPIPRTTTHRGRLQVVLAGAATETQMLYMDDPDRAHSDSEIRKWATSGIAPPELSFAGLAPSIGALPEPAAEPILTTSSVSETPSDGGEGSVSVTERHLSLVTSGDTSDRLVSIKEAVDEGIITTTVKGTYQSRAKDPTFPKMIKTRSKEYLYSANELAFWDRNRPRYKETI
jgi:hypothetical protein